MLTPEDIDKQQFSKQFKGYAVEEVDDFLEELTNDYEVLMLANKKQEDKLKEMLIEQLEILKKIEEQQQNQ